MIRVYTGRLGAGKTLSMVNDALQEFKERRPQVYTNMKSLRFPGAVYFDIENIRALTELEQGLILMDEGQLAIGSHNYMKVPDEVYSAVAQLRKNQLDLFMTAQHYDRLAVQLREKVNELVHCQTFGRWVAQRVTDPRLVDAKERRKPLRTRLRRVDRRVLWLYDTLEILGTKLGGRLGRAEWLDRLREREARSAGRGRATGKMSRAKWEGHVFEYRDNRTWIRESAARVRDWLEMNGHLEPSDRGWAATVRRELQRREWLAMFQLEGQAVPIDVTYDHPWCDGHCPCCKDGVRLVHLGVAPPVVAG